MPSMASSWVGAGLWFQSTIDVRSYRSKTSVRVSTFVVGGIRLGIPKIVVTPPAAACMLVVRMSSLWVNPGSRVCTCTSTKPGRTILPVTSTVRAASTARPGCTMPLTLPSLTSRSAVTAP